MIDYKEIQAVFDKVQQYFDKALDEYGGDYLTTDYHGHAVRYVREAFHISRSGLAREIGTSPRTLGRLENDEGVYLSIKSALNGIERIAIQRLVEKDKRWELEKGKRWGTDDDDDDDDFQLPVKRSSLADRLRSRRSTVTV